MNKRNLIPRLIVSPLIFVIMAISCLMLLFKNWILFVRYGGEWVTYKEKEPDVTLQKIYNKTKEE